jgi:hypothetical protein
LAKDYSAITNEVSYFILSSGNFQPKPDFNFEVGRKQSMSTLIPSLESPVSLMKKKLET